MCHLPQTLDSKAVLCTAFPLLGCSRHKLHSSSLRTEFISSAWTSSPNLGTVDLVPPSHLHLDVYWAFQTSGAQTELLMLSPSPLSPAGKLLCQRYRPSDDAQSLPTHPSAAATVVQALNTSLAWILPQPPAGFPCLGPRFLFSLFSK